LLFAIPLGLLVLRLRGVYFIFFTFILNEVSQIAIFETPGLTGGSDGISGVPPAALFGITFGAPNRVVLVTVIVGVLAALVTLAVTERFRAEFSAIEENEPLAESLGLVVWRYRMIGFLASAGVSGLAGFALVHQLSVAHPSEFTSFAAVNYIAYAVVGGTGSMLGPVVGAMLMVTMSNLFSTKGLYASALFGVLLTSVVMIAPDGLVGEARKFFAPAAGRCRRARSDGRSSPMKPPAFQAPEAAAGAGLQIRELGKRFGGLQVFRSIDLDVQPGEVLGVIGPNGAGKTTLINVICGMLRPSAGNVRLYGRDIGDKRFHEISRLGVLRSFQQTNTFRSASVEENLYRATRLTAGRPGPAIDIQGLLEEFGLTPHLDERADSLPYGLQKMLGLLIVLAAKPKFLLLDEPAAGLERRERSMVDRFVLFARERLNCGVLIVEHDMDLVRRLCPSILVLEAGRVLAQGAPAEVLSRQDVIDAYLGAAEE
jgi:ABC-type branched-subunit amino acid transport system ATPase component